MVLIFGAIVLYGVVRLMASEDLSDGDIMLPVIILVSVLLTRVMQTMREVGRLARSGFSAADIHRGLKAVMGERDQRGPRPSRPLTQCLHPAGDALGRSLGPAGNPWALRGVPMGE